MDKDSARHNMMQFWLEHSQEATMQEMMLDSNAELLSELELPEILSLLPNIEGTNILELGAGIGRYTQHFVKKAHHVTAVDFMKSFVEKNKQENSKHGNAEFIHSDVTQLKLSKNSFDLIFSNWLMMYLTDEELLSLTESMLSWLQPGGCLFFRESCFHQSGDRRRDFNPTQYRTPAHYNRLMTSAIWQEMETKQTFGFDIVMSKAVQTYIQVKKNQNQVSWLLQKAPRNTIGHQGYNTFQQFLDNQQYTQRGILRYEMIFGPGYVSTGGLRTTKEFVDLLNLSSGQKVLDVGCGIGGGDFYMAKRFGVEVLGMDLSSNMIEIAMERAVKENVPLVQFELGDATKRSFPESSFDVIYSRDTILHISDKLDLFRKFYLWLKPGGKILVTDYCCGEKPWSPEFQEYVRQRGYCLLTPEKYGQMIEQAGFIRACVEDRTSQFIQVIKRELKRAEDIKEEFIQEFSEEEYNTITSGWRLKIQRCERGDHRWGLFYAERNGES